MNDRDKLLRKARKTKSHTDWTSYKRMRNFCTGEVRCAKASYHQNLLNENCGNPRKFWATIKSIFPTQSCKLSVQPIDGEKTKKFSDYFKNAISMLKRKSMPLINFTWQFGTKLPSRTNERFSFGYISKVFVEKELRTLRRNKSTGLDDLPPGLLKDCAAHICGPLCHILNLSIKNATVPAIWKTAKITPIFKSGDHEFPENYRPISVLSKIMEKAVYNQLIDFLERNKLLSESQFGFQKRRFTKMAAALLCDDIRSEMDKGNLVGVVFLDLTKAFDTIGHASSLNKLFVYGVKGKELEWFTKVGGLQVIYLTESKW